MTGRVLLLGCEELPPGEHGCAQLALKRQIAVRHGELGDGVSAPEFSVLLFGQSFPPCTQELVDQLAQKSRPSGATVCGLAGYRREHSPQFRAEQAQPIQFYRAQGAASAEPPPHLRRTAQLLAQGGVLTEILRGRYLLAECGWSAFEQTRSAIEQGGSITLAAYPGQLGISRKPMQLLLEYFDRQGLTERVGDTRILKSILG